MYFQMVLKGMPRFGRHNIHEVFDGGIQSKALRSGTSAPLVDLCGLLTEDNLHDHVTAYKTLSFETPFISFTAGTRSHERDGSQFRAYSAWEKATGFATDFLHSHGSIVEAWVPCLGYPAVHLHGVAEDIRNLNEYGSFNPFWRQGEITAKLLVPPTQILRAWFLDRKGKPVAPPMDNPRAVLPDSVANVREYM